MVGVLSTLTLTLPALLVTLLYDYCNTLAVPLDCFTTNSTFATSPTRPLRYLFSTCYDDCY